MFKIGDRVVCILPNNTLTYAKVYTVIEYCGNLIRTVRVDKDEENWRHHAAWRFVLYSPLIEALI
jgi:hypothetical protein